MAHAEIMAINQASEYLKSWRLHGCTMYVTLEPCAMCAGALVNSRIDRLVIGTRDLRMGCAGTVEDLTSHEKFNHQIQVVHGVLEEECSRILSEFFLELRAEKKSLSLKESEPVYKEENRHRERCPSWFKVAVSKIVVQVHLRGSNPPPP